MIAALILATSFNKLYIVTRNGVRAYAATVSGSPRNDQTSRRCKQGGAIAKLLRTSALLLALDASVALADTSWRAMPTQVTNVLFSVDEASLMRDGDRVSFWERLVYVVPPNDDVSGKQVKEKRVHRVMDCAGKTQGHLYGAMIAEDGQRIEAVSVDAAKVQMMPIPPDTLAARELAWACAAK